jgi:alkanesulfonate monooxygenase SsuD/methylene tetrahydromethanopterin reductase-like flavin-dependent oxidoreductase (luciferase family)
VEDEYRFLRADFAARGRTADEYIAAIRTLFESDSPRFYGPTIEYDQVMFSPRPAARLPIVVGGGSKAALRRAATLGDGWHGITLNPEDVARAVTTLRSYHLPDDFEVSLRTKTKVGSRLPDARPGAALHGGPEQIQTQLHEFATAGVDQMVIEPEANTLPEFLEQISLFAGDVMESWTAPSAAP